MRKASAVISWGSVSVYRARPEDNKKMQKYYSSLCGLASLAVKLSFFLRVPGVLSGKAFLSSFASAASFAVKLFSMT